MMAYQNWPIAGEGQALDNNNPSSYPASPQGQPYNNYYYSSPPQTQSYRSYNNQAPPSSMQGPTYNSYNVVPTQGQQPYNNYSYNYPPSSPRGQPYNNTYGNYNTVSPGQTFENNYNVVSPPQQTYNSNYSSTSPPSPRNSDYMSPRSPRSSPVMTRRTWGNRNSPVENDYSHPYASPNSQGSAPSNAQSAVASYSSYSASDPLQLPAFLGKGYENVPELPQKQMIQPRYQRAADIRKESKLRERKEKLMNRHMGEPARNLEKKATSTRQKKVEKAIPNHQTINAFKFKVDHDREKIAKGRALELVNML